MSGFPWSVLGIEETREKSAIRKAYSVKLKAMNLDEQVQEYAQLRDARDMALRLAAQPPVQTASFEDDDDDWYDDDWDIGEAARVDQPRFDPEEDFGWEIRPEELSRDALVGDMGDPGVSGDELGFAAPSSPPPPPDGWEDLHAALYPDGQYSAEGLTLEEFRDAEAALDRLIAVAEDGDIAFHDRIDHALSELLASAWPRSAPLVERANQSFRWLGAAGDLDERYALQFLNARLEGMRFHEEVMDAGHPLHKAWVELSQPGKSNILDRLRTKRDDIDRVLFTVRTQFPELEALLDEERVASWEKPANETVSWIIQRLFIIFVIVQALRFCVFDDDRRPDFGAEPEASIEELRKEGLDSASATAFGAGTSFAEVEASDPEFAASFEQFLGPVQGAALYGDPRQFVRQKILFARQSAEFDTLVAIQAQKLDWLQAARKEGGDSCASVLDASFRSGGPGMTQEQLDAEQELARRLLDAKLLNVEPKTGEFSYSVPGWLIDQARGSVGLSREDFVKVMQDPSHSDRCRVQTALISYMLTAPARVPLETLRGL
ncbi:hypothetical protein [Qipengyuania gelatinilytica]|uniref:J domain-containing protein n=1 Tax=Qipengyuania gelatinilytica TaxID=2867231 RepID=A0ABX8ZZ18_9SPHN|nr:hypothetical protein [Qipengyuania gelatinilytica]QZD94265.1 hypothetical protein K3136_09175 [Qipengyuania gelatinilytica]